jgi:hypothetical protein
MPLRATTVGFVPRLKKHTNTLCGQNSEILNATVCGIHS